MEKIKVLIAPNAFKGSLSSAEAARYIAEGLKPHHSIETLSFPIADGGDDTLEILVGRFGGIYRKSKVKNPLGKIIEVEWGVVNKDTAVIEMANVSGIKLLGKDDLDPTKADTFGLGELILEVLAQGYGKILLGVGGSATVDGGAGMLRAFGARFFDAQGREILSGNPLATFADVDFGESLYKLKSAELTVLSDVDNPLLGNDGAVRVFGPQKGASEETVGKLELAMKRFASEIYKITREDFTTMKGAGAAGGIGFTLRSLYDAKLTGGFDFLVEHFHLRESLSSCQAVITGEGKIDRQTLDGKGPGRLAAIARDYGKYCIGVCGDYEWDEKLASCFDKVITINRGKPFNESVKKKTPEKLRKAGFEIGYLLNKLKFF